MQFTNLSTAVVGTECSLVDELSTHRFSMTVMSKQYSIYSIKDRRPTRTPKEKLQWESDATSKKLGELVSTH